MKNKSHFWRGIAVLVGVCLMSTFALGAAKTPPTKQKTGAAAIHATVPFQASVPQDSPYLTPFEKKVFGTVALLYYKTEGGDYNMLCTDTAFAFENKGKNIYRFVSAAHCVAEDDTVNKLVQVAPTEFFIFFDDENKFFYNAKIIAVGYQSVGDDFLVIEAKIDDRKIPIIPIAKNDGALGEPVINYAGPLGLGKFFFRGSVSMEFLDRPIIDDEASLNWTGSTMVDIPSGPGSSGSAIISVPQEAVIAILVGGFSGGGSSKFVVTRPVSKFKAFYDAVQKGTYPYFDAASPDSHATATPAQVERIVKRARQGLKFRFKDDMPNDKKSFQKNDEKTKEPSKEKTKK